MPLLESIATFLTNKLLTYKLVGRRLSFDVDFVSNQGFHAPEVRKEVSVEIEESSIFCKDSWVCLRLGGKGRYFTVAARFHMLSSGEEGVNGYEIVQWADNPPKIDGLLLEEILQIQSREND